MEVELLAHTPNGEKLIAQAYGICTGKDTIPLENIPKWIERGHLSPIEHASATFRISGVSRSLLAQLTRHRLASYSVRSMRYCLEDEWEAVVPESIKMADDYNIRTAYGLYMAGAKNMYKWLIGAGIPKQDARFCLPLATPTEIIMTANIREYRHIITLRSSLNAQGEIRGLSTEMLRQLYEVYPYIFQDLYDELSI